MKNKMMAYVLAVFLLCTFLSQNNNGFAAGTPVFSLKADAGGAGKDGLCTLMLHAADVKDIRGFEAVISYDSDIVEFIKESSAAVHPGFSVNPKIEKDKVSIAFAVTDSKDIISGNTDLYLLKFEAKLKGTATFILNSIKVVDSLGTAKEHTANSKISVAFTAASRKGVPNGNEILREAEKLIEQIRRAASIEKAFEVLELLEDYFSVPGGAPELTGRGKRTAERGIVDAFSSLLQDKTAQKIKANVVGSKAGIKIDNVKADEIIKAMDEAVRLTKEINGKLAEAGIGMKLQNRITLIVDYSKELSNTVLQIPAGIFAAAGKKGIAVVEIETGIASLEIPAGFIKTIGKASDISIEAGKATLTEKEKSLLSKSQRQLLGDNGTVYGFSLKIDGKQVSAFDSKLTVRLGYKLKDGEAGDNITAVYFADNGTAENMAAKWDGESEGVVFDTDHFSKFIVKNLVMKFKDVTKTFWGRPYIESMASKGVISGYPDGSFKPNGKVTRAEFAKMITTAMGIIDDNAKCTLKDVSKSQWYYKYAASAVNAGIIKGKTVNTFAPNDKITRQETAVMIYRALGEVPNKNPDILKGFKDLKSVSDWAGDAFAAIVDAEIMSGKPGKLLDPKGNLTRSEAAAVIYNFFNY